MCRWFSTPAGQYELYAAVPRRVRASVARFVMVSRTVETPRLPNATWQPPLYRHYSAGHGQHGQRATLDADAGRPDSSPRGKTANETRCAARRFQCWKPGPRGLTRRRHSRSERRNWPMGCCGRHSHGQPWVGHLSTYPRPFDAVHIRATAKYDNMGKQQGLSLDIVQLLEIVAPPICTIPAGTPKLVDSPHLGSGPVFLPSYSNQNPTHRQWAVRIQATTM